MTLTSGVRTPGHPGVFLAPDRPSEALRPERLDVTGFVGVAPRGPVDEPVRLGRWSDFVRTFGGFEAAPGGPVRLLPYAVSAYFQQGGQVAWVVRVAPHGQQSAPTQSAAAAFVLDFANGQGPLRAANEGAWGNGLRVALLHRATRLGPGQVEQPGVLRLPPGGSVTTGTLLRLSGPPGVALRWVDRIDDRLARGDRLRVWLDKAPAFPVGSMVTVEVVTGSLTIDDPLTGGERLDGLGLRDDHPQWLPSVLASGQHLVVAVDDWQWLDLTPPPTLTPVTARLLTPGADRSHLIDADSFFDADGQGIDEDETPGVAAVHVGVDRLARVPGLGLLCVPDLTWTSYLPTPEPPPAHPARAGQRCCDVCDIDAAEPSPTPVAAPVAGLDPRNPADLAELIDRQTKVVALAARNARFVALLDVPDALSVDQITSWRATFDSGYAAAYHPWLAVADGTGAPAIPVPPSAFAAGIIAERELRLGLPWGPANELARGAVRAEAVVTDDIHDRLHQLGINVFREERDGFRLTAARTLSSDPDYRQLSVRRLMTMIRLSLELQTQWLAFEPNTPALRERLSSVLTGFLRDLSRRGAFAGRTEAESFFVRCGDDLNPPRLQAAGTLIAEIGVAPAAPIEYILVRIARDPDGGLAVLGDE